MPDLNYELRELADEAARQARPLPVAEVIRQGDRRRRWAIIRLPRGGARTPGLAAQATPARRWSGWVAPVAAASAVTLAVGLAVVLGGQVHRGGHPGGANVGRAETAYLFNAYRGTVTPISPVTGRLGKPVKVGPSGYVIGRRRHRVQEPFISHDLILPDGTTNYALYFEGHGLGAPEALRRTSLITGAAGPPIQLGRGAQQMVITPDGTTAYVSYLRGANLQNFTLRPVSLTTGTVGRPILRANEAGPVSAQPPSITPDGRTLYVPYARQGQVTPISTATNAPGKPIPVPGEAMGVEFTPDGRTAFVTGIVRGRGQTVTPISTATNTPGRTITIGINADAWTFAPDGKTVYVIGYAAASVTPISTRTGRAGTAIPLHITGGVGAMAITPDGRTLYVTGFKDNTITPISLATNTVGKPLNVTGTGLNIVFTPDGRTAYTFGGDLRQFVTPISTATSTVGKPITTSPYNEILIPGDQNPP